jgi:hypothetical protein
MIYQPTKAELDNNIKSVAAECVSRMMRWKYFADQLNGLTDEELTTIGYNSTQIAYVRSFQAALINIELLFRNQAKIGTDDPSYFVKQMTPMLVI